ncbi:STM3941 family protein [Flavobacterium pallidum]|uniref:PH domain-containing protein n=1 Tax=Flavobacterium pallidum TaxID=2172098 RepID=A0A2S1SK60_9FLAO|nr:STM3941 family protein [Flavobacterium pallidum]AWI26775.1 hypothetical protein HYN49_13205 [Flavobacterium pallidum]
MKNERLTLRPKLGKTILLLIASLAFSIGGFFMINEKSGLGWFGIVFFGLCSLVFIIQMVPGSTELTLSGEGFEMTSLFRKNLIKWKDVKTFEVGNILRNKTVMFDYVDQHNEYNTGKSVAKRLSGSHAALPTTYGLKADELLDIMNTWKNKYGA